MSQQYTKGRAGGYRPSEPLAEGCRAAPEEAIGRRPIGAKRIDPIFPPSEWVERQPCLKRTVSNLRGAPKEPSIATESPERLADRVEAHGPSHDAEQHDDPELATIAGEEEKCLDRVVTHVLARPAEVGTRRLIEYLMSPLLRYRQESLRVRLIMFPGRIMLWRVCARAT